MNQLAALSPASARDYGKRMCLACGKEFEAAYAAQITCSGACKAERRRAQKRDIDARFRAKCKKYLLDLLAELDTAYGEMEWLNCRCEACARMAARRAEMVEALEMELRQVRAELDALRAAEEKPTTAPEKTEAPQPVENVAAKAGLPPLQECERMRLKAVQLACGEHEYCRQPTRCPRLGPEPDAAIVLEPDEKICKQCGAVFTPNAPNQKYCTKKCSEVALKAKIYGRKK